jgi:hypothetical protein
MRRHSLAETQAHVLLLLLLLLLCAFRPCWWCKHTQLLVLR